MKKKKEMSHMETKCTNIDWLKKQNVEKQIQLLQEFAKEVGDLYFYPTLNELLSEVCDSFEEAFKMGQENVEVNMVGWNDPPVGYLPDNHTGCIKMVYNLKDYADIIEEAYRNELENWLKRKI